MKLAIYEQSDEWDAMESNFEAVTSMQSNELPELPKLIVKSGIAFTGKCMVRAKADVFFGGEDSKSYKSAVMDSPTYDDLFQCAIAQQKCTNDSHHDYFEGFAVAVSVIFDSQEIAILELILGS